ncbi:hypothetical protein FNV43_RR21811 [Rhamnella rubrinervis]|uniref:BHLH domain-containing protein n=1 Tax=Rhamnella rubrinervis TaxID=2594499 RepID=A0A8K0GRH1_9ROSA|nr:hypothetical protein FNV43_RR21811 [Rhamnella rubrinervis]
MSTIMQNLMYRLRPFVGLKGWDYCAIWKLSEDQRFIESMNFCCAGNENTQNEGDQLQEPPFPVSQTRLCRDEISQHPRINSCDLLAQLPSSIPLDSGIYAETLISNQPIWLNFSDAIDSIVPKETAGTKVLIPLPGGLVELFSSKQISEDQNVMDYITSQFNMLVEQDSLSNASNMDHTIFTMNINPMTNESDQMDPNNSHLHPSLSPSTAFDNLHLPYDISVDRIRLSSSPMNFLQQFSYNPEDNTTRNDFLFECSHGSSHSNQRMGEFNSSGIQEMDEMQKSMMSDTPEMHVQYAGPVDEKEQEGNEKDPIKREGGRSDSFSDCSDQIDDEDDAKCRRRTAKGQCKNLEAERKRRKKLNERLYTLRSLVPNISKLDRASILGDAIKFVKELQKQAKELQEELGDHSENDGANNTGIGGNHNNTLSAILIHSGANLVPKPDHVRVPNELHLGASGIGNNSKQNQDSDAQQMEPQVEVAQIDGNEFFVTVTCEHKPGGFVRLMQALNYLGLEVTNANVTTFRTLVSNVFKVEQKKDNEIVQADHVRDSLLDLTRNRLRGCAEISKPAENGNGMDYQHQHHHHHSQHANSYHLHLPHV